jgi:hypothetical protein
VWSDEVVTEARRNLQADDRTAALVALVQNLGLVRDPIVAIETGEIEQSLRRTHPKDRHVVAAAAAGGATVVVTANVRHFDRNEAQQLGIAIASPDEFAATIAARNPHALVRHIQRSPPEKLAAYIERLSSELPETMSILSQLLEE